MSRPNVGRWPYPGEAPIVRARRMAVAYATRLRELAPAAAAELDELAERWGEGWVTPRRVTYDAEAYLTARQAADYAGVSVPSIAQWRRRGRLVGRLISPRVYHYRAGDVMRVAHDIRQRGRGAA